MGSPLEVRGFGLIEDIEGVYPDSKILIGSNYELKWVQPIDQFLFSAHVELVALFQLK